MSKLNKKLLELMSYYKSLNYATLAELSDIELIELIILYRQSHGGSDSKTIQLLRIINTLMHNKSKTIKAHATNMFYLLRGELLQRVDSVYKNFIANEQGK